MGPTINDPARRARMRRAVVTFPKEVAFADALCLLTAAMVVGLLRDDLLIVLQPERKAVERRAIRAGLPPECLGEHRPLRQGVGSPSDRRTGMFESDVVEVWLPEFLTRVRIEEQRQALPSFALHASDIYRDRLRQIARRERNRTKLLQEAGGDDRSRVEHAASNNEGEPEVAVAPATMAAWVPSVEERLRANALLEALRAELDPLDYKVAELYMAGLSHRGDKGEIARHLGVSASRITIATDRIAEVMRRFT